MRSAITLGEIGAVLVRDGLELLAAKYRKTLAEGKREGLENPEISARLREIEPLLERIGDVDPAFSGRIGKAWRPVTEQVPIGGAQTGDNVIGPAPGHETTIVGM